MDKLEPIIKHRFWILLGLSAPLIIYGYFSANGAMKEATQQREDALDGVIGGVPSGQLANETYANGLKAINEEFELGVALAHKAILDRQKEGMDWPPVLAEWVPDEYRGEFEQNAGYIYKDEYEGLLEDVYQIAEPITQDGSKVTGKVALQYEILPRHTFGDLSVASDEMWDAQEDIWFTRLLLEAVRTMNASSENIAKAPIRMITKLDLMGGDGQTGAAATTTSGLSLSAASGMDESMMEEMYDFDEGEAYDDEGFGVGGGFGAASSIAFDPEDEFGGAVQARSMTAASPTSGTTSMPGAMSMMIGGRSGSEEIRYIADDETKPYRERGFYLSVLIDQQQIARFLITLSNSEWPIRIVRFHVGPNPNAGGGPGGGMSGAGMYAGMALGGGEGSYGDEEYGDLMDDVGFDESTFSSVYSDAGFDAAASAYGPPRQSTGDGALAGAFSHPDLVQLDVLGAITLFKPLSEDVLAVVNSALEAAARPDQAEPEAVENEATDAAADEPAVRPEPTADESAAPPATTDEPQGQPSENGEGASDDGAEPAAVVPQPTS